MKDISFIKLAEPFESVPYREILIETRLGESALGDGDAIRAMEDARGAVLRGPWHWILRLEAVFEKDYVRVIGWTDVPDRDRPSIMTRVSFSTSAQLFYKPVCEVLRDSIRTLVLHELDESLYFDGKRTFDPHSEDRNAACS